MAGEAEAFEVGKQAANAGKAVSDNPFVAGTPEYKQWTKGFDFVATFDEDGEIPSDP